ncbi:MAG: hypothetical protein H6Q77_2086 [Gemmatimonadetes bacterium]|jgi:hypothetical protein|nr:hypothetical protein [Gemmatimonadota bacterium]
MKHNEANQGRRSFLRRAVATGVTAGAAATSLGAVARQVAPATEVEPQGQAGYRVTEHVKAYYESLTR